MKRNRTLTGRVDMQEAVATTENEFVTMKDDTFTITVKDDDDKVIYQNNKEPFKFPQVDSLANYLRYTGGKMSDDQIQFMAEALKGDDLKTAYADLLEDLNGLLKARAKQSAYSKLFNEKKPMSEETIANSQARMVRDFVRQNPTVAPADAINVLKQFVPSMANYTLEQFEANKGRV